MSLNAKKLKDEILKSGRKVGLLVEEDSQADRAITRGTKVAARLVNEGEKQARVVAKDAQAVLDDLRARIHAATAPGPKKKSREARPPRAGR